MDIKKIMKKEILIIIILLMVIQYGRSQFFAKYGLNIGATYSNQSWEFKTYKKFYKDYKKGLSIFLSSEKKLSRTLSLRSEFGYLQKGFKNNSGWSVNKVEVSGIKGRDVLINDLGLNVVFKVLPFNSKVLPYALIGFRADYILSYKDIEYIEQSSGSKFGMYDDEFNEFNKFNLGGLIGIGVEFNNLYYIDLEYNPAITNYYNSNWLKIMDDCWGLKFGININKLMKK